MARKNLKLFSDKHANFTSKIYKKGHKLFPLKMLGRLRKLFVLHQI